MGKSYSEKLKDPRWQKKRLEILERDKWTCRVCGDKETTLHVHHRFYAKRRDPWEYPDDTLLTLCENCHEEVENDRESHAESLARVDPEIEPYLFQIVDALPTLSQETQMWLLSAFFDLMEKTHRWERDGSKSDDFSLIDWLHIWQSVPFRTRESWFERLDGAVSYIIEMAVSIGQEEEKVVTDTDN